MAVRPASVWLMDSAQRQVLRAAQDPAAGRRVGIDDALEIGQQIRCALHLVENGAARKLREERSRVVQCKGPFVRVLQRHVTVIREYHPAQRGFPALPRPGQRDARRPRGCLLQHCRQVASDHKSEYNMR